MKKFSDSAVIGINTLVGFVVCLSIGFSLDAFTSASDVTIGVTGALSALFAMIIVDIILWRKGLIKL